MHAIFVYFFSISHAKHENVKLYTKRLVRFKLYLQNELKIIIKFAGARGLKLK